MPRKKIDINCDMGESLDYLISGHDLALMDYIDSVNIACGFHSGDEVIMESTVKNALKKNKNIGAHPGFEDKLNFGRNDIELPFEKIKTLVKEQIIILQGILSTYKVQMRHVKPHGALYNMASLREDYALAIAEAILEINPSLILYGLSGGRSILIGEKLGLECLYEVFADRTYHSSGSLVSRKIVGSIKTELNEVISQTQSFINNEPIITKEGTKLNVKADTICIHSDTPNALNFAKSIWGTVNSFD